MDENFYDIVVIGSGICGSVAAWLLKDTAARVLLLEAGERGRERDELVGTFARARTKGPGSPYTGDRSGTFAPGPETRKDYFQLQDPDRFQSTFLRRGGGTTWHFLGNVPRLLPSDFVLKTNYGVGVDWPIGYADLEHEYCRAEEMMGVSGDHEQWNGLLQATRSKPFPMSKIWESYSDRVVTPIIETVEVDGVPLYVTNTPQARNSQPYDGRPACAGNSSCVPICPIQAKYDGTVHLRKAIQSGVEFRDRAVVTQLEINSTDRAITAVRYLDWNRVEHVIRGRIFILAAHAIESAKILLYSNSGQGVANSSDQVGRNLMDHPQGAGGCLSPEPLYPFRGPPTTSGIDVFRDGDFRKGHAAFRMSLGNDGWGQRIESPAKTIANLVDAGVFGEDLKNRVRDRLTRQFRISFSTELLPDPANRVSLGDRRDDLNIPMPKIVFSVPKYNHDAFHKARSIIFAIFQKMKASDISFAPQDNEWTGAGHIMGTCRMGFDPKSSVTNSFGCSHDHPNLFIVGSSVFPTSGTANPTLTALALTLRTVGAVQRQLMP